MARGWESKGVEQQVESLERHSPASNRLSQAQLLRQRERESLELSRRRVIHDLQAASNPRYQQLLQTTLQFLDDKIRALDKV